MRSAHEVEEWLPGGIGLRTPVVAAVDGAEFMPEGFGSRAADERGAVGLNAVDFEGLVALGISIGQAARFISQRDRRGGITAMSEIDAFYGLTPGVRDILRRRGHV